MSIDSKNKKLVWGRTGVVVSVCSDPRNTWLFCQKAQLILNIDHSGKHAEKENRKVGEHWYKTLASLRER